MSSSLTEDYLRWLEPQSREEQDFPGRNYWDLLTLMYEKEFVWLVPNDDNRMVDGLDLRLEFSRQIGVVPRSFLDKDHPDPPCSFLEVLIGLSRRLAFAAGGTGPGWAWTLISNLELNRMSDPLSRHRARRVDDILNACIFRNYAPDGHGGFFPLGWPKEDQTKVELWYQMAIYLDELHPDR